jgi:hypothetical protein
VSRPSPGRDPFSSRVGTRLPTTSAVALGAIPAEAAAPAVSNITCKTMAPEPGKAVAGVSRKTALIVLATEIPIMVGVVEAKAEPERTIERIVRVPRISIVVSIVVVRISVRAVIRGCRARGKSEPYT